MNFTQVSEEVFYTKDPIIKVGRGDVKFLKDKAAANKRQRVRLCSHKDACDSLHEMIIVHARNAYVRPHKHTGKTESFHIIEGRLKVIIFSDKGEVKEIIDMADYQSGERFYYRLPENYFHTVVPISDFVVFHETTNGPFKREDTVFAPWAPADDEPKKHNDYIKGLTKNGE